MESYQQLSDTSRTAVLVLIRLGITDGNYSGMYPHSPALAAGESKFLGESVGFASCQHCPCAI